MARDPELIAHQEWLGYVQPVGLVVSSPALAAAQAFVKTRQFIRVLQLLAEHSQSRVERAIEACRAGHALTAEAIVQRTRALAAAEAGRSPAIDHSFEIANIPLVSVPPPDLPRFNRLLGGDAAAGRPESRAAGGAKPMIET